MGKAKSSTSSSTSTLQQDNRVVVGNDAAYGQFGSYSRDSGNTNLYALDSSDRSTRNSWLDASDRSSWSSNYSDSSQRNLSTSISDSSSRNSDDHSVINYTTTDGSAAEIARYNAALLSGVSMDQTEATKTIAKFGTDAIGTLSQAATNLFATGSADAAASWAHTIDKSGELIDHLLLTAQNTVTGAQGIAGAAIASYQPTANKDSGELSKIAMYAAIAGVALVLLKH